MNDIIPKVYSRINCLYSMYCEIAIDAFYQVLLCEDEIKDKEYRLLDCGFELEHRLIQQSLITIVFSAMTIEAFFNDYAATMIGDDAFYENFDHLSVISKFVFISKFILNKDIDKSKVYYSRLKSLIRKRDSIVHSKSKNFFEDKSYLEYKRARETLQRDTIPEVNEKTIFDKEQIDNYVRDALEGLKTIRDIAAFFDSPDTYHYFINFFFGTSHLECCPEEKSNCLRTVYSRLNIKKYLK